MITVFVPITKCKNCPHSVWYSAEGSKIKRLTAGKYTYVMNRSLMCDYNKMTVDPERIHKSCPFIANVHKEEE